MAGGWDEREPETRARDRAGAGTAAAAASASSAAAAAAAALEGGGVVVGAVALARTPAGCHGSCAQSAPAQWARPI